MQPPLAGRDRSHFVAPGPQTSYTRHRERFFPIMMMNDKIVAVIGSAFFLVLSMLHVQALSENISYIKSFIFFVEVLLRS